MNKYTLFLLTLLLPLAVDAHDVIIDNIGYNINNENKTAEVVQRDDGYKGYSSYIYLPSSIEYKGEDYSVMAIGDYAFSYCKDLLGISIPSNVVTIGSYAFNDCAKLSYIEMIASNVTKVGLRAFDNTAWLNSQPDGLVYLENVAYKYKGEMPNDTEIELREGTKVIADHAFWNHTKLVSVIFPESLVAIGESAFDACHGLSSAVLPNSLSTIGNNAFCDCRGLTSLVIPDNVTAIGNGAYWGCNGLTSLIIGRSVSSIGAMAFAKCPAIEYIYMLSEEPPLINDNSFSNYDIPLYIPKVAMEKYQSDGFWAKFENIYPLEGEREKCAAPTIAYDNGELVFSSETDSVQFVSEVKSMDIKKSQENHVALTQTYEITVYAIREGYDDSDIATATIGWRNGRPIMEGFSSIIMDSGERKGDVNEDGTVDVADIATVISIMAGNDAKE